MSPDKVILVPGVLPNFQTSVEYGLGPANLLILRASINELTVYPPSVSYFQNNLSFFFIWWIFVRFRSDISTSIKLSLALKGHIPDKCHCHTSFIQFPILTNKTRLQEWDMKQSRMDKTLKAGLVCQILVFIYQKFT
jgi:hypothetical protein